MLQFHKVFSLIIRTFARPAITYVKTYKLQSQAFSHNRLRIFFIFIGNKYNALDILLIQGIRKFSRAEMQKIKSLTDDVALVFLFILK